MNFSLLNDKIIIMKYIITFNEQSKNLCFSELKNLNANFKELLSLNDEQSLVQINLPFRELSSLILKKPCIFVRHIFAIDNIYSKPVNIAQIISDLLPMINQQKSFSVQFLTNINHADCQIKVELLAKALENMGYVLNIKAPEQIVSVYETQENIYIGLGDEKTNLSSFKAGMPHFSKKNEFISRAEYKLLEAIDLCKIDLTSFKFGADLGSAPGGWTKVLSNSNIITHSIDPANLAPKIKELPNVKHFRMTTEKYLQKYDYSNFDIIVNDMKMDINLSSDIVLDFYDRLADGGIVIMTFKLAKNFNYNNIMQCIKKLQKKYNLLLARQLFHNRSEITIALQK